MPIYEYACAACGAEFELLVRDGTVIACPSCESKKVEKKFSAFAAHAGGGGDAPPCLGSGPGCDLGKCGSGRCGLD